MGSAKSQPAAAENIRPERPEVVRIERNEIPEEYKNVGVSSSVVKRVNELNPNTPVGAGMAADIDVQKLKAELAREREEKADLRSEMAKLSELQQKTLAGTTVIVPEDIKERKRVFDDTVERVQKQFFAYQRENVCEDNEKIIMGCLKANPNRVLNCSPLVSVYEKCVADFRQEVLKGN